MALPEVACKFSLLYGFQGIATVKLLNYRGMNQHQHQNQNNLLLYRRRMRFSQQYVAGLLGHKNTSMVSRYEAGRSTPPLLTALRLEIIYRVPIAFLFGDLYDAMRKQIRAEEECLAAPSQAVLF